MSEVKKGDKVKVHYTGKLTDETIFDSSREREPIEFTVGAGQMIEGFDNAVVGMKIGDTKVVEIPSDKAYGPKREEAIITINKNQLGEGLDPQVGMQLEATQADGRKQILVIQEVKGEEIVLDGNHPLAGKELIFDIEVVEVQ
jgi:FKBP-type peptidyl-prolyl cis-trans isomerase 2